MIPTVVADICQFVGVFRCAYPGSINTQLGVYCAKPLEKTKKMNGDPTGIRTPVTAVKGRCPNRWTIGSQQGARNIGNPPCLSRDFFGFLSHVFPGSETQISRFRNRLDRIGIGPSLGPHCRTVANKGESSNRLAYHPVGTVPAMFRRNFVKHGPTVECLSFVRAN